MNIDDLRRELRSRATEPGRTSMDDRLAGVHTKVAIARRRKRAAGGAAALASLAVIGVAGSQLVGGSGDGGEGEFAALPRQLNGDLLIDDEYNASGANTLTWKVTLDDREAVATMTCQIPNAELPNDQPVQLFWIVGGSKGSFQCGETGDPDAHATVASLSSEWREAGVEPEQPFEIELSLDAEISGARFGVGLYDKTGRRVVRHETELTRVLDIDGERYRLVDHKVRPPDARRQLRMRTEESEGQIAVVYGWQVSMPSAGYELRQDGETLRTGYGGSIDGPTLIDGDTSHLLSFRADGSSRDGVLVLAYYVLDE